MAMNERRAGSIVHFSARVLLFLALMGVGHTPPDRDRSDPGDWLVEASLAAGIEFNHENGATGRFLFPEIMGAGVALLDYDSDDDLDLLMVQGCGLAGQPTSACGPTLLRNDLHGPSARSRALTFTDVTAPARRLAEGYGMGAATGDYNNDGCIDVYLTNFGRVSCS